MPTKLSRYCDGVMEAAWLAAVIVVPTFFNIYSSRIFEPDKITLLRSLALLLLAAWTVKLIDTGGMRWDRLDSEEPLLKRLLKIPLLAPVAAMVLVYLIATLFSVTPRVSLWGSYQRLQGLYSTLSYIVIFAGLVANLRRRVQVERLVTAVVLSSLPVGLYTILQRNGIDPVPWGGDVTLRVAANMGNSIFVAAYLIMVFPLTIGRMVDSFNSILREQTGLIPHALRASVYVFIASLQLVALYMSGSRGPALGWMAGVYFLALLLAMLWGKRWLVLSIALVSVILGAFLITLNVPGGPLEGLRKSPAIGRFGSLLDAESNSAKVRRYIWDGAAELVAPHEPLEYPDGRSDALNVLRPLIGYGPESMYVAYNRFYQPLLGQVERRNASPDRSHNETWDSLVITGVLGFLAYLGLFTTVFFYGFKWLGLILTSRHRWLFFASLAAFGAIGAAAMMLLQGSEYFGVGLPFGMAIGLLVYLFGFVLAGKYTPPQSAGESAAALTLIVLLSAILAHFVEINFGIAIAVTRTYFWVFSALLLLVGYILPKYGEYRTDDLSAAVPETPKDVKPARASAHRADKHAARGKRRKPEAQAAGLWSSTPWLGTALVNGLLVGILMTTLSYNYVTNGTRASSALVALWRSLTVLPGDNNATSMGVLALVLTSWVGAVVVITSETLRFRSGLRYLPLFGGTLAVSGLAGLVFGLAHAGALVALLKITPSTLQDVIGQVAMVGALLTRYYMFLIVLVAVLGYFLVEDHRGRVRAYSSANLFAAPALLVLALVLVYFTNLRIIHADVAFKMAEPFNRSGQWAVATHLYKFANSLAPAEDHYYLFLGRSYLELAKETSQVSEQDTLVKEAEKDLLQAQKINPLNTDHTANLARLYAWWATRAPDPAVKMERAQISSDYYAKAVDLSPQNSTLWGEWAILYMDTFGNYQQARSKIEHALNLDQRYSWTQGLMGDYYNRVGRTITETVRREDYFERAEEHYKNAIEFSRYFETQIKLSNLVSLAGVYIEQEQIDLAIAVYEDALTLGPKESDVWRIEETIARLYGQQGDKQNALAHASAALEVAPDEQQERIQTLIAQLQQLP